MNRRAFFSGGAATLLISSLLAGCKKKGLQDLVDDGLDALLSGPPLLPQQEDAAGLEARQQALSRARQAYTYNYSYIPPLAMTQAPLPTGEASPSVGWMLTVLPPALSVVDNLTALLSEAAPGSPQAKAAEALNTVGEAILEELKQLQALAALDRDLPGGGGGGGSTDESTGESTAERILGVVEDNQATALLWNKLEGWLMDVLRSVTGARQLSGKPDTLASFNKQYKTLARPELSQPLEPGLDSTHPSQSDDLFAYFRVGGQNPVLLRRVEAPPSKFPVTEAHYQAAMGEGDTLAAAGAEGRLYLVDWHELEGIAPTEYPKGVPQHVQAPMALFALPVGGDWLKPVAIQCHQQPATDNPVLTPADSWAWQAAKVACQGADAMHSDFLHHLGMTHMLMAAFIMATRRCLAPNHPLTVLLTPHFELTLFINESAQHGLNVTDSNTNVTANIMGGTVPSVLAMTARAVSEQDISEWMLPERLAAAGTDDPAVLKIFPYRDFGLRHWAALRKWVKRYVQVYYSDDQAVTDDPELQAWVQELESSDGGRLRGVGDGGRLRTRERLIDLVTLVIYSGTVEHASANFPLAQVGIYAPVAPYALYGPSPKDTLATQEDYFKMLPPLESALQQQVLGHVVGNTIWGQLGQYALGTFKDSELLSALDEFQTALSDIEQDLNAYNAGLAAPYSRAPYTCMLPSRIPQSINI